MEAKRFYVAGEWRKSASTRPVRNPYSGNTIEEVFQAGQSEITEAIDAATRSFAVTRRLPAYKRRSILQNISEAVAARREELARLITLETGKPIRFSRVEVERAIFTFAISAEEAGRVGGETIPLDLAAQSEDRVGIVARFPLGPVAAITPFNFPLNLVAHKVGPAIAAGDPIVLKPSSNAPGVALVLAEIVANSGWPKEAFSVLPCNSGEASQLVENEAIKLITFTGSPVVGWGLKARCGKKRVVLELGGNAGVIVDKSASLDYAIPRIVMGGFANAGQSCISVQRIFVHEDVAPAFTEKLVEAAKGLVVGNPEEDQTVVGPMIEESAARQVEGWISEAVAAGARILSGGTRKGAVLTPTILTSVKRDLAVCVNEVFAPLVTIETFSEFNDAVTRVNDSRFGLQAGLFSNDFSNIMYAYRELQVGGVVVNDASSYRMDHMPYGGVKDSGFGREGIRYAVEEMTEMKLLVMNANQ